MFPSPRGQAIPHRMLRTGTFHAREEGKCDADLDQALLPHNEQEAALLRLDPSNTHDGPKPTVKPALASGVCPPPTP